MEFIRPKHVKYTIFILSVISGIVFFYYVIEENADMAIKPMVFTGLISIICTFFMKTTEED